MRKNEGVAVYLKRAQTEFFHLQNWKKDPELFNFRTFIEEIEIYLK